MDPREEERLIREALDERAAWYDAMGDDEASAPGELREAYWEVAGLADELVKERALWRVSELLNRSAASKEIGVLVALVMIRVRGDVEEALDMLASFEGLAEPQGDELDARTIAMQAIREADGMRQPGGWPGE